MSRDISDYVVPEADGHCHWRGAIRQTNSHGKPRPTWRTHGDREHPEKLLFEAYYGIEVDGQRIARVCADEGCIAPRHHLPTASAKLLKQLVPIMEQRASLVLWLKLEVIRDRLALACEDPATFGMEPEMVRDLAARFEAPPLAVLAAHGRLVREAAHSAARAIASLREREPCPTPSTAS